MNGRKWRSVLARTMSFFLFQGCLKCFGVIFEGTVEFTHSSVMMVGWSFMVLQGMAYFVGPLISWLMDIFSYQFIGTLGSFLIGAGFIYEGFLADSLWKLLISNVISGFGLGMISLVTTVDLGETFGDQFGIVFSISTLISSVAMMLMPLLLDYWLRIYGLSWAVALLGALMWNNVPCGLMLFENYTSIWRCDDPNRRILPNQDLGLPGTSSQANDEGTTPNQSPKGRNILLAHPSLTFAILARLFNSVILFAWAIYLVPFGVSKGYSPSTAVFLSTSGGAGIFVGRTICIFVYHFQLMHSLPINVGGVVASFCMMVAFNIAESFPSLCTISFVAGALVAYHGSWMQAYTIYVVCKKHFKTAVALSNSITGAGIVATGIISGLVHDIRGSYNDVFIFLSFSAACQVLCIIPTILLIKSSKCDI